MKVAKACGFMALVVLVGCGGDGAKVKTFADLNPGDAVLRVNGENLSWGRICENLNLEYVNFLLGMRKTIKNPSDPVYTGFRERRLGAVINEMTNTILIDQEAKAHGMAVPPEEFGAACTNFVSVWRRRGLTAEDNYSSVVACLGVSEQMMNGMIAQEIRRNRYLAFLEPRVTNCTEKAIAEVRAKLADYNVRMTATNEQQMAFLRKIKAEISAGQDFGQMVEKYGEVSPSDATEWGRWNWEDFDDPEMKPLQEWAFSAPVGSVGGPYDLQDGASLVKIVSRDEGDRKVIFSTTNLATVVLARLTRRMFRIFPQPPEDEVKAQLMRHWKTKTLNDLLARLQRDMKVEHPYGTNLLDRLPPSFYEPPADLNGF